MSFPKIPGTGTPPMPSRRLFVQGVAAGGVVASLAATGLSPRAFAAAGPGLAGAPQVLSSHDVQLSIGESVANFTGRSRPAITVNGSLPAPILRRFGARRVMLAGSVAIALLTTAAGLVLDIAGAGAGAGESCVMGSPAGCTGTRRRCGRGFRPARAPCRGRTSLLTGRGFPFMRARPAHQTR